MSIRTDYFDYLSHFQSTVTLAEYASSSGPEIALRHDIDHCIDTALEMAFWESEKNIKASYFILDTAPYRNDPRLLDKCLQIQEFGHEIGIHTNSITKWFETGADPYEDTKEQIRRFRNAGVNIYGTSAHGDRACYEYNFINYWIFHGLKTDNIIARESSLNAEGIFEPDVQKQIKYPSNHQLKRADGLTLELWSGNEKDLGLIYEASHLKADAYFTDSGGSWKRSSDPIKEDLRDKRVQVLMHPIHWKAPRKIYFFLSTARSGSQWLSTILEQASSCSGRHEYTLNHFSDAGNDQVIEEKMTGHQLHELLNNENKIEEGLEHTRQLVDSQSKDYAEANVYLPLVIDQLINKFPDARLIQIHRNPADVVRSIMNRGWYDTPHDTAHPADLYDNWEQYSPFKKCCCYVRFITESLIEKCNERIVFEKMTTDPQYLKERLKTFGIAYYPLLSRDLIDKKINANKLDNFPAYEAWEPANKLSYEEQLFDMTNNLEYGKRLVDVASNAKDMNKMPTLSNRIFSWLRSKRSSCNYSNRTIIKSNDIINTSSLTSISAKCVARNIKKVDEESSIIITAISSNAHAWMLLNGGQWSKLKRNAGWQMWQNGYYTLTIASAVPEEVKVSLFCLYYDKHRNQVHKRALGNLDKGISKKIFSFAAMGNSHFFNLALYLPKQKQERHMSLEGVHLNFKSYEPINS